MKSWYIVMHMCGSFSFIIINRFYSQFKHFFEQKLFLSAFLIKRRFMCLYTHFGCAHPTPSHKTRTKTKFHVCVYTAANCILDIKNAEWRERCPVINVCHYFFQIKKIKLFIPFYDSKPYLFPPVIQILHVHYAFAYQYSYIYTRVKKWIPLEKNGSVTRFIMNKTKDSSSV